MLPVSNPSSQNHVSLNDKPDYSELEEGELIDEIDVLTHSRRHFDFRPVSPNRSPDRERYRRQPKRDENYKSQRHHYHDPPSCYSKSYPRSQPSHPTDLDMIEPSQPSFHSRSIKTEPVTYDQPIASPSTKSSKSQPLGLREMDVDEMNALRLSLGLDLLQPSQPSKSTQSQPLLNTMERIKLAKERRMERQRKQQHKVQVLQSGKVDSIAMLGDSDDSQIKSTSDWITYHREILKQKKILSQKQLQLMEMERQEMDQISINEVDQTQSHLGLRVIHNPQDLTENETILVIKDQPVLVGNQINDQSDELYNTQMLAIEKGAEDCRKKNKNKNGSRFDDEGMVGILSKYDEDEMKEDSIGFVIGEESISSMPNESGILGSTEKSLISKLEPIKMDKEKEKKKIKSHLKKRIYDNVHDDESYSVLNNLEPMIVSSSEPHLVSKGDRTRSSHENQLISDRQMQWKRYQDAAEKSRTQSQIIYPTLGLSESIHLDQNEDVNSIKMEGNEGCKAKEIVEKVIENKVKMVQQIPALIPEELVFCNETNFLVMSSDHPVHRNVNESLSSKSQGEINMDIDQDEGEEVLKLLPNEKLNSRERKSRHINRKKMTLFQDLQESNPHTTSIPSPLDGISAVLGEEPVLTKGVAGVLAFLKQRKNLDLEFYAGRVSDKKFIQMDNPSPKPSAKSGVNPNIRDQKTLNIEYLDEWGRKMTVKEAYRHFCAQWSGKAPGKNKMDKKIRKMKEQIRIEKQMSNMGTLNKLMPIQRAQANARTPCIVLNSQRALNAIKEVKDMTLSETVKPMMNETKL